jgi:glycosyltransferase involved in cell wall biosynthesis
MEYAVEQDADMVHALWIDQSEVHLLLSLLKEDLQLPVFGTIFNPRHFRTPANLLKRAYRMVNRQSLRRLLSTNRLTTLFVHSSTFKSQLVSYGVKPSRVRVIPDPVDIPDERPAKGKAREELNLPEQDLVLLFFGRFRHDKGTDILLEAIRTMDCQSLSVVFAGSPGDTTERDIQEVQSAVPNGRVILRAEFIPNDIVDHYFAAADAVVLPYRSEYSGTSGILQRAAAMNRPVIATAAGDVGPTVEHNGLGIVVEPDSVSSLQAGIQQYRNNREEIETMVDRQAVQYAEANSYEAMVDQIYEAYRDAT